MDWGHGEVVGMLEEVTGVMVMSGEGAGEPVWVQGSHILMVPLTYGYKRHTSLWSP